VLRPLLYEYEDAQFENLDDQFLLGDSLMVAPVVSQGNQAKQVSSSTSTSMVDQTRFITFPEGWWFDLNRGEWLKGGKTLSYPVGLDAVPLFARDGAIIPYHNGPIHNALMDHNDLELHIFSKEKPATLTYFIDDKKSRGYQHGYYNTVFISVTINSLKLHLDIIENGDYPIDSTKFLPVLYGYEKNCKAVLNNKNILKTKTLNLHPTLRQWVSRSIPVLA
jgi:alpha-glucosidase